MSDYVSRAKLADEATVAEYAKLGSNSTKLIRTFMASAAWDGNTLLLKDANGNNLMNTDLSTKFLPLTAGSSSQLTGDLYFNAGNTDKAIHFSSNSTAHHWRIAYLGTGSGNANYLAFQNNGADGNLDADGKTVWINALKFELEQLKAHFGSDILPTADTKYTHNIGSSSARWNDIYGTVLNISGNATIGTAATNTHTVKGNTTLTGNLTPGTNATYSLGSSSLKWKTLYVGDGTNSTSTSTGVIQANGGIAATKNGYFGGSVTATGYTGNKLTLNNTATSGNGIFLYRNSSATEALRINVDANNGTITNTNETLQSILNLVLEYKDSSNSGAGAGSKTVVFKGTSAGSEITATKFIGNLTGTASKATADADGRVIDSTYLASLSLSEHTLTAKSGDGTAISTLNVAPTNSNGIIPLKHIPAAALERVIVVANQTARFALTTDEVQNGDIVKENDTGIMYFVSDDTNLKNASGYQEFHAGMSAWAKEADYADEAGKATNDSDGNKISEKYIAYPFTLNTDKTKVTIKNGIGTSSTLDYNFYPTKWTWAGGTTAGPTATIDMAGMDDISIAAIPSASASASGIVTTGAQTFAGNKSFKGDVLPSTSATYDLGSSSYKWQLLYVNKTAYIGNGDAASAENTGALQVSGGLSTTGNSWIGGNATVDGTFKSTGAATFDSTVTITGKLTAKGAVTLGDAESDAISIVGDTAFTNDVTIGKTLTVTGAVTTKGAVTLGDTEGDTVTVNGDTTFKNDVSITKTLTVGQQAKIGNGADISTEPCDLEVAGGVDIGKNLRVTGGTVEFKQEARVVYDSTKKAFNFVFD